jgi:hypothetical protein
MAGCISQPATFFPVNITRNINTLIFPTYETRVFFDGNCLLSVLTIILYCKMLNAADLKWRYLFGPDALTCTKRNLHFDTLRYPEWCCEHVLQLLTYYCPLTSQQIPLFACRF